MAVTDASCLQWVHSPRTVDMYPTGKGPPRLWSRGRGRLRRDKGPVPRVVPFSFGAPQLPAGRVNRAPLPFAYLHTESFLAQTVNKRGQRRLGRPLERQTRNG